MPPSLFPSAEPRSSSSRDTKPALSWIRRIDNEGHAASSAQQEVGLLGLNQLALCLDVLDDRVTPQHTTWRIEGCCRGWSFDEKALLASGFIRELLDRTLGSMLLSVSKVTVAQRVCWKSRMNASTASASNVELLQGERVQRIGRFGKRDSRDPGLQRPGGRKCWMMISRPRDQQVYALLRLPPRVSQLRLRASRCRPRLGLQLPRPSMLAASC